MITGEIYDDYRWDLWWLQVRFMMITG